MAVPSSGKAKKKARALQRRSCTRSILRPPAGAGARRPVLRPPRPAGPGGGALGALGALGDLNPRKLQQQLQAALRGGAGRLTPQQRKMCADAQAMLQNLQGAPRAPAGSTSSSSASVSSSTRPILRPPRVSGI